MADGSDSVDDLNKFYSLAINNNHDFVFGNRWGNSNVTNYPKFKFFINRIVNKTISILFGINYSDFTNSFKLYTKKSLKEISPNISNHFSITVELPLKMITRVYKFHVVPNTWENREHGVSKMRIWNSILTYSMISLYCLIDKYFWNKRFVIKR